MSWITRILSDITIDVTKINKRITKKNSNLFFTAKGNEKEISDVNKRKPTTAIQILSTLTVIGNSNSLIKIPADGSNKGKQIIDGTGTFSKIAGKPLKKTM